MLGAPSCPVGVSTYHPIFGFPFVEDKARRDLKTLNMGIPGLGLFRKRNKASPDSTFEPVAASKAGVLQVSEPGRRSLSEAPANINDSVHSLHGMDTGQPANIAKRSPPPSPTSILPEVNFLDLSGSGSGSDGKGSEPSSTSPDEEHTITPDDPEWSWHELPSEVDPKDAATPDK